MAAHLYWLTSIPVLKNEKRTKFFDWSRLQLSEGLCVMRFLASKRKFDKMFLIGYIAQKLY